MILFKSKNYKKRVSFLSKKDQALLLQQEKFLVRSIDHPKLHTKKLHGFGDDKVFAFRITRSYRGVFNLRGENIFLFTIGHRKDIYKNLD